MTFLIHCPINMVRLANDIQDFSPLRDFARGVTGSILFYSFKGFLLDPEERDKFLDEFEGIGA